MQVIAQRDQTHAAAVQGVERVPRRLQSAAFWEPLLLHNTHITQ